MRSSRNSFETMVVAYKDLGFLFCCSKWLNSDFLLGKSDLQRHFRGTRFVGDPKRHFRILGGENVLESIV